MSEAVTCRSCGQPGLRPFLSLGKTPLADALLTSATLTGPEPRFPLDVAFCPSCTLVQILEEVPPQQLFVDNYLYFSSFSDHLLDHSKRHAQGLIAKRGLGADSLVVELASNDGYLLRNFVDAGVPVLGIDPAPDQAAAAERAGVPTLQEFFGDELARRIRAEHGAADVIIANNVMAHVPDLNGFVEGMRILIADDGVITVENPYVRDLVATASSTPSTTSTSATSRAPRSTPSCVATGSFSMTSSTSRNCMAARCAGTSARRRTSHETARRFLADERAAGMTVYDYYADFAGRVEHDAERAGRRCCNGLRPMARESRPTAPPPRAARCSTTQGSTRELLDYVVDRNVHKQGCFMPGVHLPIRDPGVLARRPS